METYDPYRRYDHHGTIPQSLDGNQLEDGHRHRAFRSIRLFIPRRLYFDY